MQLERLEWDSNFFGFETGKIHLTKTIEAKIESSNPYKLIYLFSDNFINEEILQKKFKNREVYFVDEKRTYKKSIAFNLIEDKNVCMYSSNRIEHNLLNLTYQSGAFSRFKIDENIDITVFKKLYRLWIENTLTDSDSEIIAYYLNKELVGFVTLDFKSEAKIGLIAVDENKRSNNIGTKLIKYLENRAYKKNLKNLSVVTQGKNLAACNFYENYGFKLDTTSFVYHIWKKIED